MKKKPTFTPARLMDVTGATTKEKLAKRWYVVYYVWSEARHEKVRKRMEVIGFLPKLVKPIRYAT